MIDIIILIFLASFVIYGLYSGLVKMALNLIASILSIILSIKFYNYVYEFFPFLGFGSDGLGRVISFVLTLAIISFILSFAFKFLAKVLKIVRFLPIVSTLNRLLGGVFGLIQGSFIIGAILLLLSHYAFLSGLIDLLKANSEIAPVFIKAVYWLKPFLPEVFENIQMILSE